MNLEQIRLLAEDDMQQVNHAIMEQLSSDVALINQLGFYIVNSGGKRLRPLLTTLAARAVGYDGTQHQTLAAIIEFIHTATLLHDDVVDESTMRRGRKTANAMFGDQASVLVGDFLYTRAFQMMVTLDSMRVMQVLADATNVIAEGEVMQLMNCNDPDTDEARYMEVIYCKTAKLFEAATHLAAELAGESESNKQAMADYGRYLGTAFQLIDDLLDYTADADALGKNLGDDLAEGKPTLPLIRAMQVGTEAQQKIIRHAIEHGAEVEQLPNIVAAIESTDAFAYTRLRADEEAMKAVKALDCLADSEYKSALIALARIAVQRDH
ncbi:MULTISPECIES: octaprenyl diphosphate synthase [Corallincola]|uniref:Octaprenyl diphosphate synthase n=2 Tax=Corallincola TaxID=1775176 RepID=A0ABY1WNE2_9GAMM|nr:MULTISPECIES: octaprenyl diphosphate synthase [Corallincola]TAA45084.1 octaprenyl diphosphate synthase [Corallincola spongiicola]TCI03636.1 octaprenyl diphosphate synthase [Corallincola luteus]